MIQELKTNVRQFMKKISVIIRRKQKPQSQIKNMV